MNQLFQTKFSSMQDALVRNHYPNSSKKELLELLSSHKWDAIVRRAARLGVRRNLSHIHTKNRLSTGESINNYAIRSSIPLSTANQIFNKYGEDYLLSYLPQEENRLELRFRKLFNELPIERWNKFIPEYDLHYKPDFKINYNNKILYLNIDGLYFHNESKSTPKYHMDMHEAFSNKDQRLMQFRSDELDDSEDIIKSIVYNYFDFKIVKLRASACSIREIETTEAGQFFTENHLMGNIKATTFGLYHNEILVAAMSCKMYSLELEIARFCSRKYTRIYGAFSKLLNYVIALKKPHGVISFCDLRYANGKSYNTLKFELMGVTLGWRWTNGIRSYNRLYCRANMDSRSLSQDEHAKELGLTKVFDAGQAKYVKALQETYQAQMDPAKDVAEKIPKVLKKLFWMNEEKSFLKELFYNNNTRESVIQKFQMKYNKTSDSIIQQMFGMKLTKSRLIKISIGETFNFWTIVEIPPTGEFVKCKCICGIEKLVKKNYLKSGRTKSCGCKRTQLCEQTSMIKYGTKRASQTKKVKDKIDETCIKKYGTKRASQVLQKKLPSTPLNSKIEQSSNLGKQDE